MDKYILALESFDKESQELYGEILMGQFMATEALSPQFTAKVKEGWATVKRIAGQIWEWIKKTARGIADSARKLVAMFRKSPTDSECSDEEYNAAANGAKQAKDKVSKANALLAKVKGFKDRFRKASQSSGEEDLSEMDAELAEALKEAEQVFGSASMDSFLGTAMEAIGGKRRARNVSSVKQTMDEVSNEAAKGSAETERATAEVNQAVNEASGKAEHDEEGEGAKKQNILQRIGSRILRILGMIGKAFASIPGFIAGLFRKLFPKKEKTTVEDYDGPSPELG